VSTLAHTVERSVLVDVPAEEVREALRDESFVSEWLGEEVELTVEEAERVCFRWRREGRGESLVELTVDAVAEGARVTVVETGPWPSASPLLAAAWGQRLESLPLILGRLVLA
jgi:uncharacterized protein YndB with AHSA1/START domain